MAFLCIIIIIITIKLLQSNYYNQIITIITITTIRLLQSKYNFNLTMLQAMGLYLQKPI